MRRYILAPEAALDLVEIWRYLKKKASVEIAERIELAIREKIVFLATMPGAGHWRKDWTDEPVRFFAVRPARPPESGGRTNPTDGRSDIRSIHI